MIPKTFDWADYDKNNRSIIEIVAEAKVTQRMREKLRHFGMSPVPYWTNVNRREFLKRLLNTIPKWLTIVHWIDGLLELGHIVAQDLFDQTVDELENNNKVIQGKMANDQTNFFMQLKDDNIAMGSTAHHMRFYLGHRHGWVNDGLGNWMLSIRQGKYGREARERMRAFCDKYNITVTEEDMKSYEPYPFLSGPRIIYNGTDAADRDRWHACILRGEEAHDLEVVQQADGNWTFSRLSNA